MCSACTHTTTGYNAPVGAATAPVGPIKGHGQIISLATQPANVRYHPNTDTTQQVPMIPTPYTLSNQPAKQPATGAQTKHRNISTTINNNRTTPKTTATNYIATHLEQYATLTPRAHAAAPQSTPQGPHRAKPPKTTGPESGPITAQNPAQTAEAPKRTQMTTPHQTVDHQGLCQPLSSKHIYSHVNPLVQNRL